MTVVANPRVQFETNAATYEAEMARIKNASNTTSASFVSMGGVMGAAGESITDGLKKGVKQMNVLAGAFGETSGYAGKFMLVLTNIAAGGTNLLAPALVAVGIGVMKLVEHFKEANAAAEAAAKEGLKDYHAALKKAEAAELDLRAAQNRRSTHDEATQEDLDNQLRIVDAIRDRIAAAKEALALAQAELHHSPDDAHTSNAVERARLSREALQQDESRLRVAQDTAAEMERQVAAEKERKRIEVGTAEAKQARTAAEARLDAIAKMAKEGTDALEKERKALDELFNSPRKAPQDNRDKEDAADQAKEDAQTKRDAAAAERKSDQIAAAARRGMIQIMQLDRKDAADRQKLGERQREDAFDLETALSSIKMAGQTDRLSIIKDGAERESAALDAQFHNLLERMKRDKVDQTELLRSIADAKVRIARNANEQIALEGDDFAAGYRAQLARLERDSKDMGRVGAEVATRLSKGLGSDVANALIAIETHSKSAKQAFKDLAVSMLADIQKIIIEAYVARLVLAAIGMAASSGSSDGGNSPGAPNAGNGDYGLGTGGSNPGGSYWAMKRMPVGGAGSDPIHIEVHNTGTPQQVDSAASMTGADGVKRLKIMVSDAIAEDVARGGPASRAMADGFDLKRSTRRR